MFTGLDRALSHYVWKCLNHSFLLGSGRLFHKESVLDGGANSKISFI